MAHVTCRNCNGPVFCPECAPQSDVVEAFGMLRGASEAPTVAAIRAFFEANRNAAYLSWCGGEMRYTYEAEAAIRERRRCHGRPCKWWAFVGTRETATMVPVGES